MRFKIKESWNEVEFEGTQKELAYFVKVKVLLTPPKPTKSKKKATSRGDY